MARTPFESHADSHSGQANHHTTLIQAEGHESVDLPNGDFVANADMLRDGQDLILRTANGDEVRVEGYFSAEPAPMLLAPNGAALTPDLVESFVKPEGGMQYAAVGTQTDVSPVGTVQEVSGKATVTHPDGTTETVTIGTKIFQGDIIETDAQGAVNIHFIDDSSFAVSQNAKLAIDEYVFDPASQGGESNFSVLRGVFVFTSGLMGRDDPDDVHINTPVGSIGIRGTTIAGNIDPNGQSQITVVEGAIVIQNGSGETTLSSEFETVRLTGFNAPIENVGVLSSDQMSQSYDSVRSVSPVLFNTIDEKAATEQQNNGQGDAHKNENAQPDAQQQDAAPETVPQPTGDATQQAAPQDQGSIADPQMEGTETLAEAEKPLDASMESSGDPLLQPTDAPLDPAMTDGTQLMSEPLPPPVMPIGFFGDMSFSGTTSTAGFDTSAGLAPQPIGMDTTIPTGEPVVNTFAPPPPPPTNILPPIGTTTAAPPPPPSSGTTQLPPPPNDFAPVINNGGSSFTVDENRPFGAVIGNVAATDADNAAPLVYTITSGNVGGAFFIDAGGVLHANGVLNFEALNVYNLTVQVSDGLHATSAAYTVNLTDVNETPIAANATFVIGENTATSTVVHTVIGNDPEGTTLSYAITSGNTDGLFAINSTTGAITLINPADFETLANSYSLTVGVTDGVNVGNTIITVGIANADDTSPTIITNTSATLNEAESTVITLAKLNSTDVDSSAANLVYTVGTTPANGRLEFVGAPGTAITSFTQTQLAAGQVRYVHNGSETTSDGFSFTVSDGINTPTGGSFAITVNPVASLLNLNVLSGADGIIKTNGTGVNFGHSIAALGDYDNAGRDDFIIANGVDTAALGGVGAVVVNSDAGYSYANAISYSSNIDAMQVAGIGDFNGDGTLDYMTGIQSANDASAVGNSGQAILSFSGATADVMLAGLTTGDRAGESIAGIGDLNGDGRMDVAIGAPGSGGDKGAVYVLFGASAPPSVVNVGTAFNGFKINGLSAGDLTGGSLASAGDFDNDGFSDFMIGAKGKGEAYIVMGKAGIANVDLSGAGGAASNIIKVTGINTAAADQHLPIVGLGDINGDGISDVGIAATGADGGRGLLHVLYGSATYNPGQTINLSAGVVPTGQGYTLTLPPAWSGSTFEGGGSAGDFNGDGIDDMAVAVRTGTKADIYVIYGQTGLSGVQGALYDPANAFHMTYNIGNTSPFRFELTSVGDANGDGFSDLAIGTPDANGGDGAVMVVYGRDANGVVDPLDTANNANDRLVGTAGADTLDNGDHLAGGSFANVSMSGGAGDDMFFIDNNAIGTIDGGTGYDTLQLLYAGNSLDFSAMGSERVGGIEKFIMGGFNQTMKIGFDDVFRLMQNSSDNTLTFMDASGGTGVVLQIDDPSSATVYSGTGASPGAFGTAMMSHGFTDGGVAGSIHTWNYGGYQLLIDTNIDTTAVV